MIGGRPWAVARHHRPVAQRPLATVQVVKDLVALTKPGIVAMCLLTTLGGYCLAGRGLSLARLLAAMLGTALAVGAANALNMYLERDSDRLMDRTLNWPLAARRLPAVVGLLFGLTFAIIAAVLLWSAVNPLAALLAIIALDTYVLLYTPLKQRSDLALHVGAVAGAIPALIGWSAATESIGLGGVLLFSMMVLWQLPHFLAIALVRREDYARANIRTVARARGPRAAAAQAVTASALLLVVTLMLWPAGLASVLFVGIAAIAGLALLVASLLLLRNINTRSARRLFLVSLGYLPLLIAALMIDKMLA